MLGMRVRATKLDERPPSIETDLGFGRISFV
jgi:hypothetical protein